MNRRTRIFHVISDLDRYGAAQSLRLLIESGAAREWDLHVVALAGSGQVGRQLARVGVRCEVIGRRWKFDPIAVARLASRLRAAAPDLVHVWDLASTAYVRFAHLSRPAWPLIATLPELPRPGSFSAGLLRRFSTQVVRYVVGSKTLREHFLQLGEEQTIQVIPPGVQPPHDAAAWREDFLAGLSLAPESRRITLAGPLTKNGPVEDAIWFFELVRTLRPEARLLIVGDGLARHRLERFARQVSDAGSVLFLGHRQEVSTILHQTDIFWQHGEADVPAAALLEAMAAGVPVVAADCLAHRELIEEGRNGLLVPPGSRADWGRTTDRLLGNSELAQRIGLAGAERVKERHSAEAMIAAYHELYRQLLP